MSADKKAFAALSKIRKRKDLKLRPTPLLRKTFEDYDGNEHELKLRYYQVQGIMHLITMPRFLLGDDTGLGKTIQSIAALCYIWEKKPNTKVIILTTKSAAGQWVDEFAKFTHDVQTWLCRGTPKKREKILREWEASEGPSVLVMGYATARQDVRTLLAIDEGYALVTDECFDYHTPVLLEDGSSELIGKLVCGEIPAKVLTWNDKLQKIEPKRISRWLRHPFKKGRRKDLLKLTFKYGKSVRVTRSHKFITSRSGRKETEASNLNTGSKVFSFSENIPSSDQTQILLGSLLGDASVTNKNRSLWGFSHVHSESQRDYLLFKRDVLGDLSSDVTWSVGGYAQSNLGRFHTRANPRMITLLSREDIFQHGSKEPTLDWLDQITPLGLAVWYADDGSINTHVNKEGKISHVISIHSSGFSRESQTLLAGWLRWKWNIKAQVKEGKKKDQGKSYLYLYFPKEEAQKFLDILPGGFPGVEYKFPKKPILSTRDLNCQMSTGIVEDEVTKVERVPPKKKHKFVYDLEVEGNHNYFAGNVLVSNCTAYKTSTTQTHQMVDHLARRASRVWALTATLIENNLLEGWAIFKVVVPGLLGSKNFFMEEYCIVQRQQIGRRWIPKVVGYRPTAPEAFKKKIAPYFLGRPKMEVATELPILTRKRFYVGMSKGQQGLYDDALAGLLEVVNSEGEKEEKELTKLTALIYCQQIVDHPELIGNNSASEKLDMLVDLLTNGDLSDRKVIVFTRFRTMIDIIISTLEKKKIQVTRITGAENEKQRTDNKKAFLKEEGARVICITDAAKQGVNLQAASAMVFFDTPWSAGDYLQILGRMIRIGSKHDSVVAYHLLARDTIDERVMQVLSGKMKLVERVLGKRLKGEQDEIEVAPENEVSLLFAMLQQDAAKRR